MTVELPHGEVEFAANLTNGFLDDSSIAFFVVATVPLDELAHLAKEFFLLLDELYAVACLVEAGVAGITV